MQRRTSLTLATVLAGGAALVAGAPAATAATPKTTDVKVMTRNVYLGADLIPIATTQPGEQFERAAGGLIDQVTASDPKGRMRLIAGEIAKARPDLVGLQEVSLYRTGPKGDGKPAKHVLFDFLGLIRKELARRHAPYVVAAKRFGLDVEGPTDRGKDVRLTLGDVTLARKGVNVRHARTGVFRNQFTITSPQLGDVSPSRSWNALDATVRGAKLHFVNTHLEAYDTVSRLEQAKELVRGPLKAKRQTVLVGDLNSGPDLEKAADRPPYAAIAKAGFKPRRAARDSCCFGDDLKSGGWDHNVDWIMARPGAKLVKSAITGRETTKAGLHPADHGGVISVLRLKR
jgi:endonuclease/exonuclease/phosphatase family metal-dependent hydrolase